VSRFEIVEKNFVVLFNSIFCRNNLFGYADIPPTLKDDKEALKKLFAIKQDLDNLMAKLKNAQQQMQHTPEHVQTDSDAQSPLTKKPKTDQ
jgi:hypothetical protein